ncbi:MAG: FHA domain-containing protein [Polyangiaceae bacterium]|nr:FHA domain-containing protein [Polyangiaceae bacterium]
MTPRPGQGSPKYVKCGRCGHDNPRELKFCGECGQRLACSDRSQAEEPASSERQEQSSARGGVRLSTVPAHSRPAAPEFDFSPRPPKVEGWICAKCARSNLEEAIVCAYCGRTRRTSSGAPVAPTVDDPVVTMPPNGGRAELGEPSDPIVCPQCQAQNEAHLRFCRDCGERLDGSLARLPGRQTSSRPAGAAATGPVARHVGVTVRPASATQDFAPVASSAVASEAPRRRAEAGPRLVLIAEDGRPGAEYPLEPDQTDIGREHGNILLAHDPYVSPRHARITQRQGRVYIRDLNSVNGLYWRLTGPHPLRHGDLLLLGLQVLKFEIVNSEEQGLGAALEHGVALFGSPAAPRYARLRQRTVEGVDRGVFYLCGNETIVGRESGDIVFTSDAFMSRSHASIVRDPTGGVFTVRDLGSSNGTHVAIRGEIQLQPGDHVRIGQHLFRLDVDARRRS